MTHPSIIANPDSRDSKLTKSREHRVCATYAPQHTCPPRCPFRGSGCYAEHGQCRMHTARINSAADALPARGRKLALAKHEAEAIDALPAQYGRPLRLHVVGDCSTKRSAETVAAAARRYMARGGGAVWTYTHAWNTVPRASWAGVSVLASVESAAGAARAHAQGYAAAAVVTQYRDTRPYPIGHGMTGIPCPATTGAAPDCARCKLCTRSEALHTKRRVILLAPHGAPNKARAALPADAIR